MADSQLQSNNLKLESSDLIKFNFEVSNNTLTADLNKIELNESLLQQNVESADNALITYGTGEPNGDTKGKIYIQI